MSSRLHTSHRVSAGARLVAVLSVIALAVLGVIVPSAGSPAHAADTAQPITSGDVTLWRLTAPNDLGGLALDARSGDAPIDTAKTAIGVRDSALVAKLDPALGGGSGYVVGPTASSPSGLGLWWDTTALSAAGYTKMTYRFNYTGPEGGKILVHSTTSSSPVAILDSGRFDMERGSAEGDSGAKNNDKIVVTETARGSATWIFTKPGTYTLTATANASGAGSMYSQRTEPLSITFKVGDAAIAGQADDPSESPEAPGPSGPVAPGSDDAIPDGADDPASNGDSASDGAPSVDIPSSLKPGESLDPWASGFSEGAQVEFLIDGTNIGSATVTDEDAVLEYAIPEDMTPGRHTLIARSGTRSVSVSFTVLNPDGSQPAPTPQPAPAEDPDAGDPAENPAAPSATPGVASACLADKPAGGNQKDPKTGRDMLYRKHVDAAHISWNDELGNFTVDVVDGPAENVRPASEVAMRLGPDADASGREVSRIKLPADNSLSFLGKPGDILWNGPGQYYDGHRPIWAGYGAGQVPSTIDPDTVKLELVSVTGPGVMSVWRSGADFVQEDFNSANPDKRVSRIVPGGHGHLNWSFTEPGRYTVTWRATAKSKSGETITSKDYDTLWLVGEDKDVDLPDCTTAGAKITTPAEAFAGGTPAGPTTPGAPSEEDADIDTVALPAKGTYECLAPGHHDLSVVTDDKGQMTSFLKDDTVSPAKKRESHTVVVPVPDSASSVLAPIGPKAALSVLGSAGATIWTLPEVQKEGLVWLGFNTEGIDYSKVTADGVGFYTEEYEGPGTMVLWDYDPMLGANARMTLRPGTGSAAGLGSRLNESEKIIFREASHRHLATSVNKPGIYRMSNLWKAEYAKDSGWPERMYAFFDVYYAVGDEAVAAACGSAPSPDPAPDESPKPQPDAKPEPDATHQPDTKPEPDATPDAKPQPRPAPTGEFTTCEAMASLPKGADIALDHGHADIFDLASDEAGALTLKIKEDVTALGTMREPEKVLLKVKQSTRQDIPETIRASIETLPASGYVLDQSGNDQATVLWPGWDTLAIRAGGYESAAFDVSYVGPYGGSIHAFTVDPFRGAESVLKDGGFELAPEGATITQDYPAHKHVNWVFSTAGRYVLTVKASAAKADGTVAQAPARTYTIDVGDQSACANAPTIAVDRTEVAQGGTIVFTATGVEPDSPVVFEVHSQTVELPAVTSDAAGTARATWTVPADFEPGTHEVTIRGRDGLSAAFAVTAATAVPDASGNGPQPTDPRSDGGSGTGGADGAGGSTGTTGGSNARAGIAKEQCLPTTITREATEDEAKNLSLGSAAGEANTATATLNFSVGGAGNVTEGHFDLGPAIEDGTVVARIKDDRSQPASWVDPGSLTFALGDAAKMKAPADVSFVASPGSDIWMIPSTQIAGVPWLGMNSQREEIVNQTSGEVVFTLVDVQGPGKVAVFNAGSLGSGVGSHIFDGAGSSYTLPANTHAHQNWLFTEPGDYRLTISMKVTPKSGSLKGSVAGTGAAGKLTPTGEKGPNGLPIVKEVVGRTPSGQPCELTAADLARTGSDASSVLVLSGLVALGGLAVLAASRRRPSAMRW
ncbi:TIGR03773 family transporter-associated surface protein [Actinomyces sp. B33]|uniref:TIGR03773 family transporter-associated surface protein n=1 Tax=Actinomyces sp. B33 TaxID=2942131 RepID=UPI0023416DC8|nr:TIGR03773 family transporter-associated surface protein [Actinomyces sp. B33]MDC4232530.1 TIGR03773 family transporter-associated surface protein [Actinomyces sp. B33]